MPGGALQLGQAPPSAADASLAGAPSIWPNPPHAPLTYLFSGTIAYFSMHPDDMDILGGDGLRVRWRQSQWDASQVAQVRGGARAMQGLQPCWRRLRAACAPCIACDSWALLNCRPRIPPGAGAAGGGPGGAP